MRTALLPTIHALDIRCPYQGDPHVNKYELAGGLMSDFMGAGPWTKAGPGALYSEVQCMIGNSYTETPPPRHEETDASENITFPKLRWQW